MHGPRDRELIAQVVPKPLEVDDGQIFFYVADIVSYSEGAPWVSVELPEHVQYLEAAVFVKVGYVPFSRGLLAGWPKKLAHIGITRLHPLVPALSKPKAGLAWEATLAGQATRYSKLGLS